MDSTAGDSWPGPDATPGTDTTWEPDTAPVSEPGTVPGFEPGAVTDSEPGPPQSSPPPSSPPPSTDDPRVDEALRPLADLADRPVGDHVAVYDDVQRQLQDILGSLDGG